jgi:CheY-like chemotaxis protein
MPHVLVIEDDPWTAWLVADELVDRGHEVSTATDAVDALQHLQETPPDVIVLDGTLGQDVLDCCLDQADRANTPIIAIGATAAEPRWLAANGVRRTLPAPVDVEALARCITDVARAPQLTGAASG